MGSFAILEADFQQYYGLNLEPTLKNGFRRCARLLINLPAESRFVVQNADGKDWNWDKEVQSQILMQLNGISCQLTNMFRKKGSSPAKPAEQFQPDYVKQAKAKALAAKNKQTVTEEEMQQIKDFWRLHNSNAKVYEE